MKKNEVAEWARTHDAFPDKLPGLRPWVWQGSGFVFATNSPFRIVHNPHFQAVFEVKFLPFLFLIPPPHRAFKPGTLVLEHKQLLATLLDELYDEGKKSLHKDFYGQSATLMVDVWSTNSNIPDLY